ncbi:aldo/keto reductase [Massilia cavernae]|uniref:aldo/keto reductase n=1 Tax=Massilia cavernae TaxID=2320864 RepID=UPI001C722897|nr:aldo/keto reductase [Massilia cavernae]
MGRRWGEGGWTGASDRTGMEALHHAIESGCNFFDTAWIYGRGHSEKMLGAALRDHPHKKLYVATKVPPKNRAWPSRRGDRLDAIFPPDHIAEYVEKSLAALGTDSLDLLQFHVWEDAWANDQSWMRAVDELKRTKLIGAVGISVNRWEPLNVIDTLKTGLIDSVQVIYNIFDQAPEDQLFPLCRELDIGVIARVPFDEGSLTGALSASTTWLEGDWRASYFVPENLVPTVARVEALRAALPGDAPLAQTALRFILDNDAVSTVIPGMRSIAHVDANLACSELGPLTEPLSRLLRQHRWDREPTWWSQ